MYGYEHDSYGEYYHTPSYNNATIFETSSEATPYYDNIIWTSPIIPTSSTTLGIERERELEAHVDTMMDRTYTLEEICPSYRNDATCTSSPSLQNLSPSFRSGIENERDLEAYADSIIERTYTWEEIHPSYRDEPTTTSSSVLHTPTDLLIDDDEYYDDVTDEEMAQNNLRCENYQKQMMEEKVEEMRDEVLLSLIAPPTQPQPIPPFHHTPTLQLNVVKHRERRYYFGSPIRRRHHRSPKFRSRTFSPPDTQPPIPLPESPNIGTNRKRGISTRHTPPLIFQRPRHPPPIRPQRKHPPHFHHHNAKRRITKKNWCTNKSRPDIRGRTSLERGPQVL
jgi:hypothetical protein